MFKNKLKKLLAEYDYVFAPNVSYSALLDASRYIAEYENILELNFEKTERESEEKRRLEKNPIIEFKIIKKF